MPNPKEQLEEILQKVGILSTLAELGVPLSQQEKDALEAQKHRLVEALLREMAAFRE